MAQTDLERRLNVLFRDWGYRWDGDALVEKGVRGFTADRIIGRFSGPLAAAEYLLPFRVNEPEYRSHLDRIREKCR